MEECRSWADVRRALDSFEVARLGWDSDGEIDQKTWVFRGHKSVSYALAPSVERVAQDLPHPWKALEFQLLREFQAKAPLHVPTDRLPPAGDKLSWLALMQHYGVPTRLLDFTYSPYVALYFALRDRRRRSPFPKFGPSIWRLSIMWPRINAGTQMRPTARRIRNRTALRLTGVPSRGRCLTPAISEQDMAYCSTKTIGRRLKSRLL